MKPYYEREGITIYHGDCLEILPQLEAGSINAVVTDPPYGLNDGTGKVSKRGNILVDFNAGEWDYDLPLGWIPECHRLLANGCWLAAWTDKLSVHAVWDAFKAAGGTPKHTFYWIKINPPPQPRANFASAIESAVVGTKGAVKVWNGGGWERNYIQHPICTGVERTMHPTQKPVAVMGRLVGLLSYTGHTVLDAFMGAGTTGVACVRTGRRFIGIELEEKYCEIAAKRIEQAIMQPSLALEVD